MAVLINNGVIQVCGGSHCSSGVPTAAPSPLRACPERTERTVPLQNKERRTLIPVSMATILLAWPFLAGCVRLTPAAEPPGEYELKAAFLYNFAKFVEWPLQQDEKPSGQVVIGVLGKDPFGDTLEKTILGKTVNGHEVRIERFRGVEEAKACQILFISSSERQRVGRILADLQGAPVLTVSDMEGFAEMGGAISFLVLENRIRLAINVDSVAAARLKISSKLLALARVVHTKRVAGAS